ncbi:hypothetical protein [Micrococcus luteus]|uniref:hypothetical protein n=1 Tax=Micrococcus luteus TaxID=1270 RepID=UPI0011C05225|nr:hypothetical protein [Micrococcus luteus]
MAGNPAKFGAQPFGGFTVHEFNPCPEIVGQREYVVGQPYLDRIGAVFFRRFARAARKVRL